MKFMVLVKATTDSEAGRIPKREEFESMIAFNEQLANDGVLLAAEGLRASSKGTKRSSNVSRTYRSSMVRSSRFASFSSPKISGVCFRRRCARSPIASPRPHDLKVSLARSSQLQDIRVDVGDVFAVGTYRMSGAGCSGHDLCANFASAAGVDVEGITRSRFYETRR